MTTPLPPSTQKLYNSKDVYNQIRAESTQPYLNIYTAEGLELAGLSKDDIKKIKGADEMIQDKEIAIVNKAIEDNKNVLIFSLHMTKEHLVSNILLNKSKIEQSKIEEEKLTDEELTDEEWKKIILAIKKLLNIKLYIDDTPSITIEKIREKCIKLKKEKDIDLIVIDNVQLITTDIDIEDKRAYINNELKKLEQELDIAVITTSTATADDM